jgi:hypothetical protein
MPTKQKSYWWRDKSGRWHYHKPGTPPARNAVDTSTTKPSNIPEGVTPTKPTGGSSGTTQTKPSRYPVKPPISTATPTDGSTASGGRPVLGGTTPKPPQTVDPGFYRKDQRVTGKTRDSAVYSPGNTPWKSNLNSPSASPSALTAKQGTGTQDRKGVSKGQVKQSNKPVTLGRKGSVGRKTTGGSGLEAVNAGQGSRKVYDDAKARLLKKKRGNSAYRP